MEVEKWEVRYNGRESNRMDEVYQRKYKVKGEGRREEDMK